MPAFGDHPGVHAEWLDDQSDVVPCSTCGDDAYARWRINVGAGHRLHVHQVVACVPCGVWAVSCQPPVPAPDQPAEVAP